MTPQLAQLMAAYNRWMNVQIYDAAARLSDEELQADKGAFFGSILGTLNHLCAADTICAGPCDAARGCKCRYGCGRASP